jgi:hypothetical protein
MFAKIAKVQGVNEAFQKNIYISHLKKKKKKKALQLDYEMCHHNLLNI